MADLGLLCLSVGEQTKVQDIRERTLQHHALIYVESGQGDLHIDGRHHPVGHGTMVMLPPGSPHTFRSDRHGWTERWVSFTGPATDLFREVGLLDPRRPVFPVPDVEPVLRQFGRIRQGCGLSGHLRHLTLSAALQQLILDARPADVDPNGLPVQQLLARLGAAATTHRSVAQYADLLGVSVQQLRCVVGRVAGSSVNGFLLGARMSRAKELLTTTDLQVSRIAARVGYTDHAYFSRVFSRHTGLSPSGFRAAYLHGSSAPAQQP